MSQLIYRTVTAPVRFFVARDAFISYARRDASGYAEALATALSETKPSFTCSIDQWHSAAGRQIPPSVLRAARWSRALIVVATRQALTSTSMDTEIAAFGLQPGPMLVIAVPGVTIQDAVWWPRVEGIVPIEESEDAFAQGQVSREVLKKVANCCKFWRHSRRIVWASGFGFVAVLAAGIVSWLLGRAAARAVELRESATATAQAASERADQMRKRADAIQMLLRAEDRYATDSSGTLNVLEIGMQSLALSPTPWGESVVRRGLMLLPAFAGASTVAVPEVHTIVPRRRPAQVAFGRSGVLAQWIFDDEASTRANAWTYRISFTTPTGEPWRSPVRLQGFVKDVLFAGNGQGVVADVDLRDAVDGRALFWIASDDSSPRQLTSTATAFALHPTGDRMLVATRDRVDRWLLVPEPRVESSWPVTRIASIAFAADSKRALAVQDDRIVSLHMDMPGAKPTLITSLPPGDARRGTAELMDLVMTSRHVVIAPLSGKVRSWDLDKAKWDHELDAGQVLSMATADRIAIWNEREVTLWDLAEDGVQFIAGSVSADCGSDRLRDVRVRDVALSADGRRVALACADGAARLFSTSDGTSLAVAPLPGVIPKAVALDAPGHTLYAYATNGPNTAKGAQISSWQALNAASERFGGDGDPRAPLGFSLSSDGRRLAVIFSSKGLQANLRLYDPGTGQQISRAHADVDGLTFTVAVSDSYVATASPTELTIWRVDGAHLHREATLSVPRIVAMQFESSHLAVSSQHQGDAGLTQRFDREGGSWREGAPAASRVWTRQGSPDPEQIAPVTVAANGALAYLSAEVAEGKGVTVERRSGDPLRLMHEQPVTQLRFVSTDRLVVGTRAGELFVWQLDGVPPVRTLVGRHQSDIESIVVGDEGRIISVGKDSIVRMWSLTTSSADVGLRGFMEFPLINFGIAGYDPLGAKALGFSGEALVTINHHARGLFANTWSIPLASRLVDEATRRMGTASGSR